MGSWSGSQPRRTDIYRRRRMMANTSERSGCSFQYLTSLVDGEPVVKQGCRHSFPAPTTLHCIRHQMRGRRRAVGNGVLLVFLLRFVKHHWFDWFACCVLWPDTMVLQGNHARQHSPGIGSMPQLMSPSAPSGANIITFLPRPKLGADKSNSIR